MGAAVVMERPAAPVEPGGQATSDVRIRNTGAVVDQFELDLVGEVATWAHVEPSTVNLLPGEESIASIVFAPPRSARVGEGTKAFALRVMSREDTAGSAIQEATVDVAAFSQTAGELLPRTSTGSRRGRHQLVLDNLGNHPNLVAVAATDPDLKLSFRLDPANPTLEPGTATFVKVLAKPRKTFVRGSNVTMPFQVTATPADGDAVVLPGSMVQTPMLPPWFFKMLAAVVAACLILAVLWFTLLKPTVESTARAVAEDNTKKLAKAITAASDKAAKAQEDAAAAQQAASGSSGSSGSKAASGSGGSGSSGSGSGASGSGGAGKTDQAGSKGGSGTAPGESGSEVAAGTLVSQDAVDFRVTTDVAPAGGFVPSTFTPPARKTVWISDLVLQNPAGDTGILRIQRGNDVLMVFGLENFRDLDYHFIQPAQFSQAEPVVVSVDCKNPADSCTPSVYFSGQQVAVPKKATNKKKKG